MIFLGFFEQFPKLNGSSIFNQVSLNARWKASCVCVCYQMTVNFQLTLCV